MRAGRDDRGGIGPSAARWHLAAFVAALVPLLVAGWILTGTGGVPNGVGPGSFARPSADELEADALEPAPAPETREPAVRDDDETREPLALTLHVTVLDAQRQPVEEAVIAVFPAPALLAQDQAESGVLASTSAVGEASVTLGSWTTHVLDVRKDGFASARREVTPGTR